MSFFRGCDTNSWYYRLESADAYGGESVMLIPSAKAAYQFGHVCPYAAGNIVPDDEVPDEVLAALAKWRLMQ